MTLKDVDWRTVATLVVLDLVTYVAVYWVVVPPIHEAVLFGLPAPTQLAVALTLSTVRLVLVGCFAARSLRARRGLARRRDAVPSMVAGVVVATVVQVVAGCLSAALTGAPLAPMAVVVAVAQWLAFPLVGLLFVAPGEADRLHRGARKALNWRVGAG
ncbi:hypothetical protein [Xylanimonas ulmi]|uniref:Uncharacterized protein n=1 Tax=Xylanimonas ulmi TaxID=228973 RepID=A0A4Q7M7K6_9MICO|nr:hypothetical protein [Xylanibacterium ulmi]RZS63093.1 hypothetical protein EV386_3451 [Xylanibacterium ulmi]